MDGALYDMIFRRKSFHIFRNVGDEKVTDGEICDIMKAYEGFDPLFPGIRTAVRIVPARETTCRRGEEYCILMYSEKKDGYLQNIGYLGEQLDLYLVSRDIGTLWYGIGKTDEKSLDGMDFVIMIAIRKISDRSRYRKDMFRSKRKTADEIWKGEQIPGVTDIVRFAPSACNSQPWLVESADGKLSVFRYRKEGKRGIMPAVLVTYYNRIDTGIFLCFLDLCLARTGKAWERKLYPDDGEERELTLNAEYIFSAPPESDQDRDKAPVTAKRPEYWDAYNERFEKIEGVTLVRGEPVPDGLYHLVCDVIVRHTDGSYLLMLRDRRKHFGGMWEATAGGSALKGEDPLTCAARELREETGIEAEDITEVGRVAGGHALYAEFLCVTGCAKDSVVLQQGETEAYRWVSKDELLSMKHDELVTERMQCFIDELMTSDG